MKRLYTTTGAEIEINKTINNAADINPKINAASPKKLSQSSFEVARSKTKNKTKKIKKNTNLLKTMLNFFLLSSPFTTIFEELALFLTLFFLGILLYY